VLSYLHLCFRDKDGYLWLTGRVDDVINVRYLLDFIIFPLVILFIFGQASEVHTYIHIKYVHTFINLLIFTHFSKNWHLSQHVSILLLGRNHESFFTLRLSDSLKICAVVIELAQQKWNLL
jgi:hypothetical protein